MKEAKIPLPVLYVVDRLTQEGFEAFVVGGAVRDLALGKKEILDWDITTNAKPEEIQPIFNESFYDNAFGTVMVAVKHVWEQMNQAGLVESTELPSEFETMDVFDITTYRNEKGYSNNRHPDEVVWGDSLEEDVKRRDFTINAMAIKLEIQDLRFKNQELVEVEVVDFHGGMEDLGNKLIRTVGNAEERFGEDALRMMRAIRIGAQLAFEIEETTLKAIGAKADLISNVSWERVQVELFKILASDFAADGIGLMHSSGLLKHILPELEEGIGVAQGGRHKTDVWTHGLDSLRECPSGDVIVRLATLLHDVGKPRTAKKQGPRGVTFYGHEVVGAHMCNKISDRLRLSKKQRNKLFTLVRWHMFTYQPEMTDAAIKRFIRRVGLENINDMMMLRVGDRKGGGSRATSWRLRELQKRIGENLYEPLSVKDLKVDGTDVMDRLGMKPGRAVGVILNKLFEEVMEDRLENDKEVLLNRVDELANEEGLEQVN